MNVDGLKVVVRGSGDIGSAVAHQLVREACAVVIQEDPTPTTTRRGMAFTDAVFDGWTSLDGIDAIRARDTTDVRRLLAAREAIPVYVGALLWGGLLLRDAGLRALVSPRGQAAIA